MKQKLNIMLLTLTLFTSASYSYDVSGECYFWASRADLEKDKTLRDYQYESILLTEAILACEKVSKKLSKEYEDRLIANAKKIKTKSLKRN